MCDGVAFNQVNREFKSIDELGLNSINYIRFVRLRAKNPHRNSAKHLNIHVYVSIIVVLCPSLVNIFNMKVLRLGGFRMHPATGGVHIASGSVTMCGTHAESSSHTLNPRGHCD